MGNDLIDYKAIFDTIQDGIAILESDTIIAVNKALNSFLRKHHFGNIVGTSILDYPLDTEKGRAMANIKRLLSQETDIVETTYLIKSPEGNVMQLATKGLLLDSSKSRFYLQIKNIDKPKVVDEAFAIDENQKSIYSILPMGVVIHNAEDITYTNPFFEKIEKELFVDSIVGKSIQSLYITENKDIDNTTLGLPKSEKFLQYTHSIVSKNGGLRYFNITNYCFDVGQKKYWVLIFQDISTQHEMNRRLITLKRAIDRSEIGVMILSGLGEIKYINDTFSVFKNADVPSLIGKNIYSFKEMGKDDLILQDIFHCINQQSDLRKEYDFPIRKNRIITYEITVNRVNIDVGENDYIVQIQDITDRIKLKNKVKEFNLQLKEKVANKTIQLKQEKERLEKNQKAMLYLLEDIQEISKKERMTNKKLEQAVADLESFNLTISHDLKQPLRTIRNYSQFILEDNTFQEDNESKKMLMEIHHQSIQMSKLMNGLLNYSRHGNEVLSFTKIDMNELAAALFSELLMHQKRKAEYDIKIENLPPLVADYQLMKQVFINLISNAVKFTSKRNHPKISLKGEEKEGNIIYRIKDNGIGLDQSQSSNMLGVFKRLPNASEYEGNGLGLAIVDRIIKSHSGSIEVQSEIDKGCEFKIVLPKREVL